MTTARGNPLAVRVGAGKLFAAPLLSIEPVDLATPWDDAWARVGYTEAGSTFTFGATFEDVMVAEELEAIRVLQTNRNIQIAFAAAELTATNMQRVFNGGTIQTPTGLITFEPPPAGEFTEIMLGWESDDALERWIFRKCIQTGSVGIPRQKAAKAQLPMTFRALKPDNDDHDNAVPSFKLIHDANYTVGS